MRGSLSNVVTNVAKQRMPKANVQARMLLSNESLRGMLRECQRRFLLKQNQKEKQNGCNGKSPIDRTFEKYV